MSTGLSDALSRMARGDHNPTKPHGKAIPSGKRSVTSDDTNPLVELGESKGKMVGAQASIVPSPASRRPRPPVKRDANHGLKAAAVPILITVGVLLMIPGIWSLLILTGVWESPREDAKTMAVAMLATWPIAASIFAGAGFFWWQIRSK